MHSYRGFNIIISGCRDMNYPFLAQCYVGKELITKKGTDEKQVIGLMESLIDFTIGMHQLKK